MTCSFTILRDSTLQYHTVLEHMQRRIIITIFQSCATRSEILHPICKLHYEATRVSITVKFLLAFQLKRKDGEREREVKGGQILVLENRLRYLYLIFSTFWLFGKCNGREWCPTLLVIYLSLSFVPNHRLNWKHCANYPMMQACT